MNILAKALLTSALALPLSALAAQTPTSGAASQTQKNIVKKSEDDSMIVLTGNVAEVRDDEFDMSYGGNTVTVELDRFGWDGEETRYLTPGESVTVTGFVDDDLFEGREIEAYNIRLNTSMVYYYTTVNPEPVYYTQSMDRLPEEGTFVSMTGEIVNIDGSEITVENDSGKIKVDTAQLAYNPFDNDGMQKLEKGDRVYVSGDVNDNFYEKKEIQADSILELTQGKMNK